ncbi:MAG: hypothetical protein M3198_17940 [Actinomycetota bacterium]|nr:hypothetical protein [Actinomycetota bacterium]
MGSRGLRVEHDSLVIDDLRITFQRTLRIPDDGRDYPLPPGLGSFPIRRVDDYLDTVPDAWSEHGGVFIPMYQREAMWMSFHVEDRTPLALKVGIGKIDALTGDQWGEGLCAEPQNYLVRPEQPWLDGINAGDGFIRQFVAMPLGMGYTVEGQVTGNEEFGGIQLEAFRPKPDKLEEIAKEMRFVLSSMAPDGPDACYSPDMGLGAGGKMVQDIYPDPHGIDLWDPASGRRVFVHIANSTAWRDITGEEPPPTPVSAELYTRHGYPWFELYDEHKGDIKKSDSLAAIDTIAGVDKKKGFGAQQDDSTVGVPEGQVVKLGPPGAVRDGDW